MANAPESKIWNIPTEYDGSDEDPIPSEDLGDIPYVKPYNLLNGDVSEIEPYLLRGSVAAMYKWVPLNSIDPTDAIKCLDGFIRSHLHNVMTRKPPSVTEAQARIVAIILGATRAVMTANYNLSNHEINADEMVTPVLSATVGPDGTVAYKPLVAKNATYRDRLVTPMQYSAVEKTIIKVAMRCAQAIPPLQGLNLITDGHHYLSDKGKPSFKSFFAVEKQIWAPVEFKEVFNAEPDLIRDAMWHKAGHPIVVKLKEAAATDPVVKERLDAAKLGSATARLPALETEARAASTFLKVADSVDAIWSDYDGGMDASPLRVALSMLESFPRGAPPVPESQARELMAGVRLRTRNEALVALRALVEKSSDKVAMAYGFYCSMMENTAAETGELSSDTLKSAFSLVKLKRNNTAAYVAGVELYKDYRAAKARARTAGQLVMPQLRIEM